jgi:hypothetical protein
MPTETRRRAEGFTGDDLTQCTGAARGGSGTVLCMTTRTVPLLAAAALAAAVVPAHGAGLPKTNKCGTVVTKNGAKAQYIRAYKVNCTTAKAVAQRATGKTSYATSSFACRKTGPTYLCTKAGSKQTVVFTYKKASGRA